MSQIRMRQPISDYIFDGPFVSTKQLPETSGIFAVTCSDLKKHYLLDVGYAINIRKKVNQCPRQGCWEKNKLGHIMYAYLHDKNLDKESYMSIIKEIRIKYTNIPCGNK